MKTLVTLILVNVLLIAGTAFADTGSPLKPYRVYTANHQPNGRPTKASSFAPRPGGTKRRVYGAPIQAPIFKTIPKKPTSARAPAPS